MRIHGPFSGMSARRLQLGPCTLGERVHPEVAKEVVGDLQLLARVKASAFASQPFAVEKVSTGKIDGDPGSAESLDRLDVELFSMLAFGEERLGACRDPESPVCAASPGHGHETT